MNHPDCVVLDASVIIKWLRRDPVHEEWTREATALVESAVRGETEILQPCHWLAEVAAVLCRLSPETADDTVLKLQAMGLPVTDHPRVLRTACRLAAAGGTHVFDTLYHAVALEHTGAVLITADRSYWQKSRNSGAIRLLGN